MTKPLALLVCAFLVAAADASASPPFPPDGRGVRAIELDVGALLSRQGSAPAAFGPGDQPLAPPPLPIPDQHACQSWCRAVGGCQLWSFCAEPKGCGSGSDDQRWAHGLCSLFAKGGDEAGAAASPLPLYASAPASGYRALAGFVQGAVALDPPCAAASASAAQCEACKQRTGSDAPKRLTSCLACAERQAPGAASVRVAIGEGRGTGAGAEAASSCALCAGLGGDDTAGASIRRRCERCLQQEEKEGCGLCLTELPEALGAGRGGAAERAAAAADRVAGCLSCVFEGEQGEDEQSDAATPPPPPPLARACVQCASSSRDPAGCYACVKAAKANFCRAGEGEENQNGSATAGCIARRDAESVCHTCVEASQGTVASLCSSAAARVPFSPDVAACAAISPRERAADCYECAAEAKTAVGGCADCSSLPGEMRRHGGARRRRALASQQQLLLQPAAAFSSSSPSLAPDNNATRHTSSVPPFVVSNDSPAADCAACVADPSLSSDEARVWCFSCSARHRDDAKARAACHACLRRPLEELVAAEEQQQGQQQQGGGGGGRARRGRGGAPRGYGDLCP